MVSKRVKAGVAYTICNVILKGISFFSVPIFIRLLSPEEFGKYNIFILIEGILIILSGLAIHSSIKNAFYDKKSTYDTYIKNCVYIDIVVSILIGIIANLSCLFFSESIDLTYTEVNLLTISGFCHSLISIYTSKLIMEYQPNGFIVVSFITVICGITLSLFFILTIFDYNHYYGRIWGAVSGQIIASIFVIRNLFKDGFAPFNLQDWKYGLKISLPIVPHGISQIILSSSDRLMIKYIQNVVFAGIYSFTYTISLVPQVLFASLSNVWEPWFFEQMNKADHKTLKKGANHFFLLISTIYILMACIVPEMVKILATSDYYDSIDISILILGGCYFATLYYIPCEVEYYYKKTKYIAISTMCCAVLNIILNYWLLTHYSYKSAALSTFVSYLAYFLFHMTMSKRISHQWLFDMKVIIIGIIITLSLMGTALIYISNIFIRGIIFIIVIGFLYYQNRDYIHSNIHKLWKQRINN